MAVPIIACSNIISQKVFIKLFYKSQFPRKFVNFFFIITNIQDTLTFFCGNCLLPNDFINAFCQIRLMLCVCSVPQHYVAMLVATRLNAFYASYEGGCLWNTCTNF